MSSEFKRPSFRRLVRRAIARGEKMVTNPAPAQRPSIEFEGGQRMRCQRGRPCSMPPFEWGSTWRIIRGTVLRIVPHRCSCWWRVSVQATTARGARFGPWQTQGWREAGVPSTHSWSRPDSNSRLFHGRLNSRLDTCLFGVLAH